jgi:hypothetical protein
LVGLFRRLLALALVAALTLMNVQAAEMHVHADQLDEAHHHGPAAHHHDPSDHHSADAATAIARVDADDTVILVALVAATPQSAKPMRADHAAAPVFHPAESMIVDGARIVPRAHGPPSLVQPPLRAPPAHLSL